MNTAALKQTIALLEGTVGAKSDVTCTQFLTVMYAIVNDGITQRELAKTIGISESAVSRNIRKLGPEGTGCLYKDGNLVKAADHVLKSFEAIVG